MTKWNYTKKQYVLARLFTIYLMSRNALNPRALFCNLNRSRLDRDSPASTQFLL
jgi:hypothetical protein